MMWACLSCSPRATRTPEESLLSDFPRIKQGHLRPFNIQGVYEGHIDNEVFYYVPEQGYLILGEIITRDGRNLTVERKQELFSQKVKEKLREIPLTKALIIGNGKHRIIEITDPDCPFCRKASDFFSQRTDTTRYIFFNPLPIHPRAKEKVMYILCAENRAEAYKAAMTGKLDDIELKTCDEEETKSLLEVHQGVADMLGIHGTPFFFVDENTAVFGADIQKLEQLLHDRK